MIFTNTDIRAICSTARKAYKPRAYKFYRLTVSESWDDAVDYVRSLKDKDLCRLIDEYDSSCNIDAFGPRGTVSLSTQLCMLRLTNAMAGRFIDEEE